MKPEKGQIKNNARQGRRNASKQVIVLHMVIKVGQTILFRLPGFQRKMENKKM